MPFINVPSELMKTLTTTSTTPSFSSPIIDNNPQTSQFPSFPSPPITSHGTDGSFDTFESIALKAKEVNQERAARRKAIREARELSLLQSQSQGSSSGPGSGSGGYSSVESSLASDPTAALSSSTSATISMEERRENRVLPDSRCSMVNCDVPASQSFLSTLISPSGPDLRLSPVHSEESSSRHNRDIPMEEDDDADLKRLMNQAENMLHISDHSDRPQAIVSTTPGDTKVPPSNTRLNSINKGAQPFAADATGERRQRAINYLEGIFLGLLQDIERSTKILNHREIERGLGKGKSSSIMSIPKVRKRRLDDNDDEAEGSDDEEDDVDESKSQGGQVGITLKLKSRTTGEDQIITFPDDPSSTRKESALHRITQRCRVAELLYEAVLSGCVTTKRDIYYKDVQLFKSQYVVDKIVDDLVATAGLKRQDFNVASLIPPIERIDRIISQDGVKWVLIVEKDAVFQTLLSLKVLDQVDHPGGVLITGKGYPDLATLQLCDLISQTYPTATFHALVDADPHGIDIMQVYTLGSKSTTHSHDHKGLALGSRLRWIGVKATEWLALGVGYDQLLELTDKDIEKAMAMLRRRDLGVGCRRELQHMLHLNKKAEIQILSGIREDEEQSLESIYTDDGGFSGVRVPRLLSYVMERLVLN